MGNVKQNTTTGAVMNENQDSTNDPMRAIGMSAAERAVRELLQHVGPENDTVELGGQTNAEWVTLEGGIGILHTLMRDLDMWREIVANDIDKWSFDALMAMAKRILAEVYPEDVFTGESANTPGNEGVTFVVALR